jgi:hypothetical protein
MFKRSPDYLRTLPRCAKCRNQSATLINGECGRCFRYNNPDRDYEPCADRRESRAERAAARENAKLYG